MADGLKLSIQIKGLAELRARFAKLRTAISTKRELHRRYGLQALNWIDDNFRQEGKLSGAPWAKLSPNTIVAKGSSAILQNKGPLRASFNAVPSTQDVRVGSPLTIAKYHEEGTGLYGAKGTSYLIYPKRAKALAFQVANKSFKGGKLKTVQFGVGGAIGQIASERTKTVEASFSSVGSRRTFKQGQTYTLASSVLHPGVQKRPMLPTPTTQSLLVKLYKVTLQLMKEVGPEIK
jgi:hypothetical protein